MEPSPNDADNWTIRIEAPTFVAGVCYCGDDLTSAYRVAPIVGYMRGWGRARVLAYARKRGWAVLEMNTPTVAFSMRSLKTVTRDRLHAIAALREAKTGARITLEQIVNEALERGVAALEVEAFGPKLAAKLAAKLKAAP